MKYFKLKLVFWFILFSFFATSQSINLDNGLVAYYHPFNGNSKDESGNRNQSFVRGISLTNNWFEILDRFNNLKSNGDYIKAGSHNFNSVTKGVSSWFCVNTFYETVILGIGEPYCGKTWFKNLNGVECCWNLIAYWLPDLITTKTAFDRRLNLNISAFIIGSDDTSSVMHYSDSPISLY
jgi:hypothetical protein